MFKYEKNVDKPLNDNLFITVAGNVGAGKSTLTRLVGEKLGFETHYETVEKNPYLEKFYGDQKKWGFHLQLYFLSQRFKQQSDFNKNNLNNIQDRSIYEDVEIFARNLFDNGTMTEDDYFTYKELFHNMVDYLKTPDLLIYINGSLDSIVNRINSRGREMEKQVDISYWENLHNRYEGFIEGYNKSNVLYVDIDQVDLLEGDGHLDLLCDKIKEILNIK